MMFERYSVSDLDIEKSIILGLIISTNFIKSIKDFCKVSLFQVPYARIVASWCFDYYNKYSAAPENHIMEIFNYNINNGKIQEDIVELIEKFLSNLEIDSNFIDKNIKYHVDKASEYFRLRQVELLRDSLTDLCTKKLVDEAESAVGSFKRLSTASIDGIDVIHDDISFMFEDEEKLFRLRGALGELVGDICRQDFISIAAPMKRGKTYWLQEIGLEAYWRGLNVLFYSLEMSEKKMLRRIFQYLLAETKQPCEVEIPYFDELNNIKIDKRKKKGLSDAMVSRKQKKLEKLLQSKFLLCTRPTGSINVSDIKIHLDNLQHYKNFIPDVIIIDYADIMASEKNSSREERHKLNDIWKALRGLAQERNCTVVTATQTNRSTFNKDIEEDDIAEDIRKLAHATTVIALNQSKEDKRNNIMRVKVLVARDDEFYTDDEVIVLECRKIGKCYIDSRWAKDVDIK